jgi:Spy/CpxP family protein refolding chaperone
MKRFKAVAGVMAIFTLGAMTGVLGAHLVVKHRIEMFHEKGPPPIKPMFKKRIIDRLDLTPTQREAVEKILDELQVQLREIRQDFHPKIKAAFDASFDRIKALLDESQKKEMDILLKELPDHFPPHGGCGKRECDRFDPHRMMPPPPPDEKPHHPKF